MSADLCLIKKLSRPIKMVILTTENVIHISRFANFIIKHEKIILDRLVCKVLPGKAKINLSLIDTLIDF